MTKKIAKSNAGRKTLMTEEIVNKLEEIFKIGGTIDEACSYAMISRQTYYNWIEQDKDFLTKMESAQRYIDIAAKRNVGYAITKEKDLNTSKWLLEKKQFNQPQTQVNVAGKEVGVTINFSPEQAERLLDEPIEGTAEEIS